MSGARVAIVDYEMGNLRSVEKAFEHVGAKTAVTRDARVIRDATHVVLPGVGAFSACMKNLERYGLIDPLLRSMEGGKPFLGICLGLQLLFDESEEQGTHRGLGVIPGRVVRFPVHRRAANAGAEASSSSIGGGGAPAPELKVPHMGWNDIVRQKDSRLLAGVPDGSFFYFVHSYYVRPSDASVTLTTTGYGMEFASSIAQDNVLACQFHPEKSQGVGLTVLRNFSGMN